MKLSEKDREFLERLKGLMASRDLSVELKSDRPSYMVLRRAYGDKIHRTFGMTRQGVRWRFQRVFNDIYVAAFSTIVLIEKTFGTQLREHAIRISKERYELREEMRCGGVDAVASHTKHVGAEGREGTRRGDQSESGG